MARHRVIPSDDPRYPAIRRRLFETFAKTILGYLAMGGLVWGAFAYFGTSLADFGWGTALYLLLPVVLWWYSADLAIYLQKAEPADPSNPEHKRLLDIVDRVYAKTDLKFKPPVYVSPTPIPNAFATGPIHRRAKVAATAGLFACGMTDEEIEAVFAHELGHVRNYDVAINSFLNILSQMFFLIVNAAVVAWMGTIAIFKRIFGIREEQKILPAIVGNIFMYLIFWVINQLTSLIQFFVVRSRESGADATGAYFTGNPCALATALLKLVAYAEKNRPKPGYEEAYWRGMRCIAIIDPLYDTHVADPEPKGLWEQIKRWWKEAHLTHPPVPERVHELERMNGAACPRPKLD